MPDDGGRVDRAVRELPDRRVAAGASSAEVAVVLARQPGAVPVSGRPADRSLCWGGRTRRLCGAAGIVALLTGSVAAAAGGRVPLPRPVRIVAYSLGVPVDSPALDDAHRRLRFLEDAVEDGDAGRALRSVRELRDALLRLPDDEHDEVQGHVDEVLAAAAPLLVEGTGFAVVLPADPAAAQKP